VTATALELPSVGSEAPDFTLPSTSGNAVTLAALRGKTVLLAFFPLAFTSVCTAELSAISGDIGAFRGVEAEVLPISVDSIPTLKEFKAKEHLTLDLLSDLKREASRRYGTLLEDKQFSQRAYVLIDRDGIVRWTHAEEHAGMRRENSELLAEIAKLG
jgi:peroxiredoxin